LRVPTATYRIQFHPNFKFVDAEALIPYARAKAELAVVQSRIDQLKEQLVGFAQQQNAAVLQGMSARVTVRTREWNSFPGRNDEGRQELEDLIRATGKWNEVTQLDGRALAEVLEDQAWPRELIEQLGRFAIRKSSTSIYLSGMDDISDADGSSETA
jgi:hypothetical protein